MSRFGVLAFPLSIPSQAIQPTATDGGRDARNHKHRSRSSESAFQAGVCWSFHQGRRRPGSVVSVDPVSFVRPRCQGDAGTRPPSGGRGAEGRCCGKEDSAFPASIPSQAIRPTTIVGGQDARSHKSAIAILRIRVPSLNDPLTGTRPSVREQRGHTPSSTCSSYSISNRSLCLASSWARLRKTCCRPGSVVRSASRVYRVNAAFSAFIATTSTSW